MKFCKVLEGQDKDIPEFNHIVLRYKQLKKKIKAIPKAAPASLAGPCGPDAHAEAQPVRSATAVHPTEPSPVTASASETAAVPDQAHSSDEAAGPGPGTLSTEEQDFMGTLNEDVNRFNSFFMEKEEDAVIRLQSIEEQLQAATDTEQLNEIRSRLVNFHGELVMILHWSLINYSAIVKILKKHDKRSGVLLRAPYLANVLTQPFSSTNVMSRLVKRCEELVAAAAEHQLPRKRAKVSHADTSRAEAGAEAPGPGPSSSGRQWQQQSQRKASGEREARGQHKAQGKLEVQGEREAGAESDAQRRISEVSSDDEGSSLTEVSPPEDPAIRRTKLALEMWQALAKSASTPSTILNPEGSAAPTPVIHCGGSEAPHPVAPPHEALGLNPDGEARMSEAAATGQGRAADHAFSSCEVAGSAGTSAGGAGLRGGIKRRSDVAFGGRDGSELP